MTSLPETTLTDSESPFVLNPLLERLNQAIYALWKIPYPDAQVSRIPEEKPVSTPETVLSSPPDLDRSASDPCLSNAIGEPIIGFTPFTSGKTIARARGIKRSKPKMAQKLGRRKLKWLP
jgi:hypothetical protein